MQETNLNWGKQFKTTTRVNKKIFEILNFNRKFNLNIILINEA